jgi:hypothetical protein
LFRRENHRFVLGGGLAPDEAHRVRLLISWDQPVTLAVLVNERHNTANLVERRIGKTFLTFQGCQPLLDLQRFDAERDSVPPAWQQPIAECSLVTSNRRVCFRMDRFGGFDEFMFCVVMCQIRKCHTSAEIHLVDLEMLPFHLFPRRVIAREVFDKTNWNLVLHSLAVGFPNCTERTRPKFHLDCVFLFLTNLVDVCASFADLLLASQVLE